MIQITELTETCSGCPAQWEGQTLDGQAVYIRYRFGTLSLTVAPTQGEMFDTTASLVKRVGGEWDGFMEQDEMLQHVEPVARMHDSERPHIASRAEPPQEALAPEIPARDLEMIQNPASWPLGEHLPVKRVLAELENGQALQTGFIPAENLTAVQMAGGWAAYPSVEELLRAGWRVD